VEEEFHEVRGSKGALDERDLRASGARVTPHLLVASISSTVPIWGAFVARGGTLLKEDLVGQYYEQFLELPVPVVLAVMWVVGTVLEGALVAALYWNGLVLVQLVEDIL
jgi:hypothetical protein